MKRKEAILTVILFLGTIAFFTLSYVFIPQREVSITERRKLDMFPDASFSEIISGEIFDDFDSYTTDQFPMRDSIRKLKAFWNNNVFNRKDDNDVYIVDGAAYKIEYPLDESSVNKFAERIISIRDTYYANSNAYYAVIPEKSVFVAGDNGYPSYSHDRMIEILNEKISNIEYVELYDTLDTEDFYNTDLHWRQENLQNVIERLGEKMDFDPIDVETLNKNHFSDFYGGYFGQSALSLSPDTLTYLTGGDIDAAEVTYHESGKVSGVYSTEALGGMDSYDVYLSGAETLIEINNPNNDSGRTLTIFRDSFSSSLAPLLIENYSKIIMIDLRYINLDYAYQIIPPTDGDVLFLFGAGLVNSSQTIVK